jgi:arylsulfatase A-like enzyme
MPGYLEGYRTTQWRTTPGATVTSGDWKLIEFFEDGRLELYNLRSDLREKRNLASAMPEKAEELHEVMLGWRAETLALMPVRK